MALTKIAAAGLTADLIDETKLADDSIDSEHYNDGSIDNAHLADNAVGVDELSATGTAGSTTYLRGDNTWTVPPDTTTNTQLSTEEVQDIAGPLVATGGTKTGIAVTYDDANGNMDFVVASQTPEGTAILSTGESGGTKFLREDGDGTSSWQTVSAGTALTGSTNNTVCTVTGANAIQGEANLTFDGSTLGVTGGLEVATHPVVGYASTLSSYATRLGSTGTSTLRYTQIYGGGNLIATCDGTNGNVKINDGDLVIGTAGHGIDFSAQATTGATGGTMADELLDHYEQGTWTPTISYDSGSGDFVGNVASASGNYIRIGDLVWISGTVTLTTARTSFNAHLGFSQLPFNARHSDNGGIMKGVGSIEPLNYPYSWRTWRCSPAYTSFDASIYWTSESCTGFNFGAVYMA